MGSIYFVSHCLIILICLLWSQIAVCAKVPPLSEKFYRLVDPKDIPAYLKKIFAPNSTNAIVGRPTFTPFYIGLNEKQLKLQICKDDSYACSGEDQIVVFCYPGLNVTGGHIKSETGLCPPDMCYVKLTFADESFLFRNEEGYEKEGKKKCFEVGVKQEEREITHELDKHVIKEWKLTFEDIENVDVTQLKCAVHMMHTYQGELYIRGAIRRPIDQVCRPVVTMDKKVNQILIPESQRPTTTTTMVYEDTITEETVTEIDSTTVESVGFAMAKHWWIFLILLFLLIFIIVAIIIPLKWEWIKKKYQGTNSNNDGSKPVIPLDFDRPSEHTRQSKEVISSVVKFDNVDQKKKVSSSEKRDTIRVPNKQAPAKKESNATKTKTNTNESKSKSLLATPTKEEPVVQRIETKSTATSTATTAPPEMVTPIKVLPEVPLLPPVSEPAGLKSLPSLENEMTPDELEYLAFSTMSIGKRYRIFRAAVRRAEQIAEKHGFYISGREPTVNDEEEEWYRNGADSLIKTCIEQHGEPLPEIGDTHNDHLVYIATHSLREIYQVALYVELEDSTRMYFLNAVVERFKDLMKKFPLEELRKGRHPMKLLVQVYQDHPDVFNKSIMKPPPSSAATPPKEKE